MKPRLRTRLVTVQCEARAYLRMYFAASSQTSFAMCEVVRSVAVWPPSSFGTTEA